MDPEILYDDEWKRKRALANARVRKHREWKRKEAELLKSMTQDKANDEIRKQKIQEMDDQRRKELARERWRRDQEDILKIEEENLKQRRELARERSRRYRERKRIQAERLKSTQDKAEDEIENGEIQEMTNQRCKELAREEYSLQQRRELAKESSRRYRERKRIKAEQLKSMQDKAEDEIRKREIQESNNERRKELARERLRRDQEDISTLENSLQKRRELAKERSRRYRQRKRLRGLKSGDRMNHDSQSPGPSQDDDPENVNSVEENRAGLSRVVNFVKQEDQENLLLPCKEGNLPIDFDDDSADQENLPLACKEENLPIDFDDDSADQENLLLACKEENLPIDFDDDSADQENLLLACKEENLPIDFDDDSANQACASPTSNVQLNGLSTTYNSSKEIEDEEQNQSYKWCCVPSCNNTTKNSPNQIFIHVPNCQEKRVLCSNLFCCEDHLNLTEDVANYGYHKLTGGRIFMKPSVVPAKVHCEPSLRRTQDQFTGGTVDIKEEKLVVEPSTAMEPSSPSIPSRTLPVSSTSKEPVFVKVERHSPVDFEEFSEDPLSNGSAKRQKLLVDLSTETGTSMPSNSSKETEAASMSWTSVFIKDEPHSPVRNEGGSADPLFYNKKRTFVEIGVQTDIRTEYVSMATYCNLDSEEPI